MDLLKEPIPAKNTYELDCYIDVILKLHAQFDFPEFVESYDAKAKEIELTYPDLANFLRRAEALWKQFEAKEYKV